MNSGEVIGFSMTMLNLMMTQLYTLPSYSIGSCLDRLALCTAELQHWYWANDLLPNPDKSEAAFFGTWQGLRPSNHGPRDN